MEVPDLLAVHRAHADGHDVAALQRAVGAGGVGGGGVLALGLFVLRAGSARAILLIRRRGGWSDLARTPPPPAAAAAAAVSNLERDHHLRAALPGQHLVHAHLLGQRHAVQRDDRVPDRDIQPRLAQRPPGEIVPLIAADDVRDSIPTHLRVPHEVAPEPPGRGRTSARGRPGVAEAHVDPRVSRQRALPVRDAARVAVRHPGVEPLVPAYPPRLQQRLRPLRERVDLGGDASVDVDEPGPSIERVLVDVFAVAVLLVRLGPRLVRSELDVSVHGLFHEHAPAVHAEDDGPHPGGDQHRGLQSTDVKLTQRADAAGVLVVGVVSAFVFRVRAAVVAVIRRV
eukprot:30358-Pelagococcus_subviridis.AAC.10